MANDTRPADADADAARSPAGAALSPRAGFSVGRLCAMLAGWFVYGFLCLPVLVIVLSAFTPDAYPSFPPRSLSLHWFHALFANPDWLRALAVSGWLLLIVTPATVVLGTSAAYALARLQFRGRAVLQAFVLSPLIIPQVVLGIALLYVLTAAGLGGSLLGMAAGHIVVALPYAVRTVSVSLASVDRRLESASMNLGASPATTFRRVTLPLIKPGIVAGAVFAAVTSFGEVSVSLFLTAPDTVTMPVRIFTYINQTFDPTVNAVSALFIGLAIVALVILEKTIGLTKAL